MEKKINSHILFLLKILIFLFIVCQKIVINIKSFEFSVSFFAFIIFFCFLLYQKKVKLNAKRTIVFILIMILNFFSFLLNRQSSLTSLLYFFVIYFFFIYDYNFSLDNKQKILMYIEKLILISSIIGILQFALQLIGIVYIDIFDFFPSNIRMSGFNTYYPIKYGSPIIKSNGWFFLEPSFFSQFVVIGIAIELKKNKINIFNLAILLLALICSFSGTGIVLLLCLALTNYKLIKKSTRRKIILMGSILFLAFLASGYASSVLDRIFEYKEENSSAKFRFINPYKIVFEQNFSCFLFGNGPGTCDSHTSNLIANFSVIPKMIYEYGILSSLLFIYLIYKSFKKCNRGHLFIILVMYLVLGGNLLQPVITLFLLLFSQFGISEKYKSYELESVNYEGNNFSRGKWNEALSTNNGNK